VRLRTRVELILRKQHSGDASLCRHDASGVDARLAVRASLGIGSVSCVGIKPRSDGVRRDDQPKQCSAAKAVTLQLVETPVSI
jgi:hypothetical protein